MSARARGVLVYDGDCSFCTRAVHVLERFGPDAEIVPWQLADLAELGVTEEQAAAAVQWVAVDGAVHSGHVAIAEALKTAGPIWRIVGGLMLLPGISWLAAQVYQLVAANRGRLA